MKTTARNQALLDEIASYFEVLASDTEDFAERGLGNKKTLSVRAATLREAADDIRSIELVNDENGDENG